MPTLSRAAVIRLSNLWLILSGSLSVLGMFAFHAGWLSSSPTSIVTQSLKQIDESKKAQHALYNPELAKGSMQLFSLEESPSLMPSNQVKNQVAKSNDTKTSETMVNDETIGMARTQKGIHSFVLMQP